MPLNIEVKGEPGSIRQTAGWLRSTSGSVDQCGGQVGTACSQSEGGWTGDAADRFRGVMGEVRTKVDEVGGDLHGTAGALDRHAEDLDKVKTKMDEARGIASEAGLTTTASSIAEPGPAPAEPQPLGSSPTPTERQAHGQATQLASAYTAKVRAYHKAANMVNAARQTETQSQNLLVKFLKEQAQKSPFTVTDLSSGLAAAAAARTSKYRAAATKFARNADVAGRLAGNRTMSAAGRARATILQVENRVNAQAAAQKATATRLARAVDRLPSWARKGISANLDSGIKSTTPILGKAAPVLRRVPYVGAIVTAAGIGYDIHSGKNPVQSTVSGVSSLAAGAAVGAMIGGPVGVVVGGLVGAGVGFVVDEWGDEIASGVGDAAGWVGDKLGDIF